MKKDINISKKSLIALIIVIIVLFTTTIITTTLLFARSNKQEKIDNSNLTDRQVIEYLENENYKFEKSSFSDDDSTIYTTISNDNVYLQKIVNIYLGTIYTFGNEVYNDENAVKIVLQNVLETSIKLTDTGSITIKCDHPDLELVEKCGAKLIKDAENTSYVRISITDTGMGLAESELEGIFEPYTQLDKVHKKTIVRSITLGTAYTITKRLGGAIWINSEVMKGSTFYIILPVEKNI